MGTAPAALAAAVALALVVLVVRARRRAYRWRAGAVGEAQTAEVLERLERHGFVALHDRRMPRFDRANIDHLVVGPTGVFTVETKRYAGTVSLGGFLGTGVGRLRSRHNGKRLDHVVDQAHFQASAASKALGGAPVIPLVVVHNAELRCPRWRRPRTDGVRWCAGGDDLAWVLRRGPTVLSRRQVGATADRLDHALARAHSPPVGQRRP